MKRTPLILLIAVAVWMVAGCTGSTESTTDQAPPVKNEGVSAAPASEGTATEGSGK